jgi:V/A-type H+-transporting ATPase subunit I
MLRPEQMSKVSVAGSQRVLGDVIEAIHDLELVHLSDYDGNIEGFDNGDPMAGADEAAEKLVTVRSLKSILDVSEADAGPTRIVTDEALETELEEIRVEANELDDRRSELEDDLRDVEERIEAVEPFADLGIDLDLLRGYESLQVAVGEGEEAAVRRALRESSRVAAFETFSGDDTLGAFVYPKDGDDDAALDDALVGVDFTRIEVPEDAEASPGEYVAKLRDERNTVETKLERVDAELAEFRQEHAGFLLAAEEKLAIDVQKAEVPLQFASTDRAFVAEGWIPTDEYDAFDESVRAAVGEHAAVEELERADYEPSGHGHQAPAEDHDDTHADAAAATDGGTNAEFDESDSPPVVQDNPGPVSPFESLTEVINRPKYTELDPTVVLFLTFPAFYGFMIGDLGYGILYTALGFWLYSSFDSEMISKLGGVAMWAGGFTALFGVLYGEIFGLHLITNYVWEPVVGLADAPLKKGLHVGAFAELWLAASLVYGIAHLAIGYVFGLVNEMRSHGLKAAVTESGGQMLLMLGVGAWLFSTHMQSGGGPRPELLYRVVDLVPGISGGLPPIVGIVGLVAALAGLVLVTIGEGAAGFLESPTYALVNTVSYTRIAAVLLAKAGMAYVVNLLVFGAYDVDLTSEAAQAHGYEVYTADYLFGLFPTEIHHETHFMLFSGPGKYQAEYYSVLFDGLIHMGWGGVLAGVLVLVVGHALVLGLGVTSAGLQALRLEYVEFFNKFYEGGGEKYNPFGYTRNYTTED